MRVTGGGLHLEDPILNGKQGHIERAASHVVDQHVALPARLLVQPVRDGSSGGLIDDTEHVDTGDGASILRGLPLGVVEVRRHGHNRVVYRSSQESLSSLLHLHQDHGTDLLRVELLLLRLVGHLHHRLVTRSRNHLERPQLHVRLHDGIVKLAANQSLRVEDRVLRVPRHLVLRRITDQSLGVCEGNVRRGRSVALIVGDDLNRVVLPHAHTGVGGSQIDTDSRGLLGHGGKWTVFVFGTTNRR
mmetsp:Transcript_37729/g.86407  ORF Transcript_37729/g.86407 Transcript_37729/m.86407 type:complete len:245 (+) Transcript_37729:588-1322(+)